MSQPQAMYMVHVSRTAQEPSEVLVMFGTAEEAQQAVNNDLQEVAKSVGVPPQRTAEFGYQSQTYPHATAVHAATNPKWRHLPVYSILPLDKPAIVEPGEFEPGPDTP